jgi:hypothetical protein
MEQNIKYAYCLIRPPSHHSSLNRYNGFCIVNHTYLTAKYLHDKHNKKILILDYDVHHGDGTQALVNQHLEDDVYFISMHCYGHGFYPGTGDVDENNEKVLNIPINRGKGDELYLERFNDVKDYINSKEIDIIIISNGLDAHHADPFGVMYLTNKFYVKVTEYLKSLDKPLIYILEGGYNPNTIGRISIDIIKVLTSIFINGVINNLNLNNTLYLTNVTTNNILVNNIVCSGCQSEPNSPDRIDSSIGYLKGNIRWVSRAMNWMKNMKVVRLLWSLVSKSVFSRDTGVGFEFQ